MNDVTLLSLPCNDLTDLRRPIVASNNFLTHDNTVSQILALPVIADLASFNINPADVIADPVY